MSAWPGRRQSSQERDATDAAGLVSILDIGLPALPAFSQLPGTPPRNPSGNAANLSGNILVNRPSSNAPKRFPN